MTKVSQSVSFSEDDYAFLIEIRNKYHQKNLSQTIHVFIKEHIELVKFNNVLREKLKDHPEVSPKKETRKPINPFVQP
jgi:hypothetical protein